MNKVTHRLKNILKEDRESEAIVEKIRITNEPIVWADDLAFAVMTHDNSILLDKVARITAEVDQCFESLGMEVNYSKGKSEVLACFRGPGAATQRRGWLTGETTGCEMQAGEDRKLHLSITAAYKHLGIFHGGAGALDVELNHRISQAWSMWRSIRSSVLCSRRIQKQTRIRLAFSLIMTKLFHGAGSWPLLTRRQTQKIHTCYVKILRMTAGCTFKANEISKLRRDDFFLAEFGLPSVEVKIAMERLLYAARTYRHSADLMQGILQAEFDARPDSWISALLGDIKWITAVQGDQWGTSLSQLTCAWATRSGWKPFVKTAVRRHILQEKLAFAIRTGDNLGITVEVEGGDDPHECFCGKSFGTATALAVHKRTIHHLHAPEFWMARGSRCHTCMKEFWTRSGLQQHLAYTSRKGTANRCFTLQTFKPDPIDLDSEEPSVPCKVKGLRRHEAIRLEGPLPFGMDDADGKWAIQEREKLECILREDHGILEVENCWVQDLDETLEKDYRTHRNFDSILQILDHHQLETRHEATTLLFWGMQRSWESSREKKEWLELLHTYEESETLLEWFYVGTLQAFFKSLTQASPHHLNEGKAANGQERARRDANVLRNLTSCSQETVYPIQVSGKFVTKAMVHQALAPGASTAFLRSLIG